jgi:hypothetical protein
MRRKTVALIFATAAAAVAIIPLTGASADTTDNQGVIDPSSGVCVNLATALQHALNTSDQSAITRCTVVPN